MGMLDGKVAIVTGAAQGMGEAHVRRFVAEGARVTMTDVNAERGAQIAAELGESVRFIEHDVSSLEGWRRVVEETDAAFGPPTVLVNNAGILGPLAGLDELDEQSYLHVCAVNQHAQRYCSEQPTSFARTSVSPPTRWHLDNERGSRPSSGTTPRWSQPSWKDARLRSKKP